MVRKVRRRRDWHRGHLRQLACGFDFYVPDITGWGDPTHCPPDERHKWPSKEALAEMQACWTEHREEIMAMSPHREVTFAELVFEQGLSPQEAMDRLSRHELRNDPKAYQT